MLFYKKQRANPYSDDPRYDWAELIFYLDLESFNLVATGYFCSEIKSEIIVLDATISSGIRLSVAVWTPKKVQKCKGRET